MLSTSAPASRARCLGVWLGIVLAAASVLLWVLPDLQEAARHLGGTAAGEVPFARWLTWLSAAALAGCALWAAYVGSVVVLEALRGPRPAAPPSSHPSARSSTRLGVPAWSRRLVLAACGAALVAGVPGGAHALPADRPGGSADDPGAAGARRSQLHGLPLPERAQAGSVTDLVGGLLLTSATSQRPAAGPQQQPQQPQQPASPPAAQARPADHPPRSHTVTPGESLWSVAASALAADAAPGKSVTAEDVAAYWPRLHAANRAAIGPDPDLITPGQRLVLPPPTDQPREDLR